MRKLKAFIIFLICFILQSTLLSHFSLFGSSPDLILVLTVVYSFFFENYNGLVLGAIFGILQDISFGQVTGLSGLVYLCIGMALQFLRLSVYRDNPVTLFFVTAVCTAAHGFGMWGLNALALPLSYSFTEVLVCLPAAIVWNYVFLIPAVHFARRSEGFTT